MTTQKYICIPNLEGTFDNQLQCKNDINDAAVLPPPPVELNKEQVTQVVDPLTILPVASPPAVSSDIGDIANYAYIWFNTSNPSETITEEEKDFIHKTITKGTFPTYFKTYSDKDKKELLANEIIFVRKQFIKAGFSNITILQIPRILYDLFNLFYFYKTHDGIYAKSNEIIIYNCIGIIKSENEIDTINKYNKYTDDNINKLKNNIFELNDKIITFLNTNSFLVSNIIVKDYTDILDLIIKDISKISVEYRKHVSPRIDDLTKINILYEVLAFENKPASKSILLYRGAMIDLDSTIIDLGDRWGKEPYSLSANLSILSGFIADHSACTINYMTGFSSGEELYNNKIKYTINKFMFGDRSPEDFLFFIPPIPAYLQLYCDGELWHPRTKIGNDMVIKIMPRGLGCKINFSENYTYLQSDKTMAQLEEMYQLYKTNGNIATWRKYIKYKTKYLELKNQLGK